MMQGATTVLSHYHISPLPPPNKQVQTFCLVFVVDIAEILVFSGHRGCVGQCESTGARSVPAMLADDLRQVA